MARGDYRGCDVCDGKAFYDANLSYEDGTSEYAKNYPPYRIAGAEQYDKPELLDKYGFRLGHVGDWAVICTDCSPKFVTVILTREQAEELQRKGETK
jgi:V8-like Glu-specific endopeptidase